MDPDDGDAVRIARANALALYGDLAAQLRAHVDAMRAGRPSDETRQLVKAHQQTLLMVLGFEEALVNRRRGPAASGGVPLDRDAARAEVARRLARLKAGLVKRKPPRRAQP
jgi:hypothetical protein